MPDGPAVATRVGIIAAVSLDGVIAQRGRIPWDEPADRAYFKRRTVGHAVVMGRRTWQSLPLRPLPGRDNLVLTGRKLDGARTFDRLEDALAAAEGEAWLIGGAQVYREGLAHADLVHITRVPVHIGDEDVVHMPVIPEPTFTQVAPEALTDRLVVERWQRRRPS